MGTSRLKKSGRGLSILLVLVITSLLLQLLGRSWWCSCGKPFLWAGDVWSRHNSQHLLDPYVFTHLLHGFVLCGLLAWTMPRFPAAWQLCLAVTLEAGWEIAENSNYIIQRYRTATAAIGYEGDSVFNSLGDILVCAAGFIIATRLGFRLSLLVFLIIEGALLLWIRDSLLLNILMLIYPIDGVRAWQLARTAG